MFLRLLCASDDDALVPDGVTIEGPAASVRRPGGAGALVLGACALSLAVAAEDASERDSLAMSHFAVYEENRQESMPSYITEDFVLLAYSMIWVEVAHSRDRDVLAPQLRALVAALKKGTNTSQPGEATSANRDFLVVLRALADGAAEIADAGEMAWAQAELDLVLAGSGIAQSPLWGRRMDYGQFRVRGYYGADELLARHFRAARYAGGVLFPVQPSKATGVSIEEAQLASQQARALVALVEGDAELTRLYHGFVGELTWLYGPPDDLTNADLQALPLEPVQTFNQRLLAYARANDAQPHVIGEIVDSSKLEPNITIADALTGWRLLPQRRTPESVALQGMVFDATGAFQVLPDDQGEDRPEPQTLTFINGQAVKGFPLLAELMCMWGSQPSCQNLRDEGESRFGGYWDAIERGRRVLAAADGLAGLQRSLIVSAFSSCGERCDDRLTSIRALWTWQRYASALYAKQSYTPTGKGISLDPPRRPGARVEPSLDIYMALARVVEGHRQRTPHPSWDAFAAILDRLIEVAARHDYLSPEDEEFLNNLDVELKALTGGPDGPIIVDIHTNPARGEVLYEATGLARVADEQNRPWSSGGSARGARLSQCEFFGAMETRLTDAEWRELLPAPSSDAEPFFLGSPCPQGTEAVR